MTPIEPYGEDCGKRTYSIEAYLECSSMHALGVIEILILFVCFQNFTNLFGQPIVCLLSPTVYPKSMQGIHFTDISSFVNSQQWCHTATVPCCVHRVLLHMSVSSSSSFLCVPQNRIDQNRIEQNIFIVIAYSCIYIYIYAFSRHFYSK